MGDSCDVVVIGAGVSGLTAAALLARAGKSVLVVEAADKPGGYARAICRDGYTLDRADNLTTSCQADGPFGQGAIDAVLRHLGVRDLCQFTPVTDPFYVARYPGFELEVPCGRQQFIEAHARHFPQEEHGLRRLVELSAHLKEEFRSFPMIPRTVDLAEMPVRWPTLFHYRNATLADLMNRELSDPRLKTVYATLWSWIGLPPSQASFLMWAVMMADFVEDGAYYPVGSFDSLVGALARGLTDAGGELTLGTRVARILTDGGAVRGVELDSGQKVAARSVVSTVDARKTFEQLLPAEQLPTRFMRRLRAMDVSMSTAAIYVGTDLDPRSFGARHETIVIDDWDHERTYALGLGGQTPGAIVVIPSLTDPSLAPPGHHAIMVQTGAARESDELPHDDAAIADRMLSYAERVVPGLRDHLTFVETPDDGGTYPAVHRMGPIYGFALTPAQSGPRRLHPKTPIDGLVLAGQWTQPAPGTWIVVRSGIQAARLVLGERTDVPALPIGLGGSA